VNDQQSGLRLKKYIHTYDNNNYILLIFGGVPGDKERKKGG